MTDKPTGDGVARYSVPHPLEITEAMVEAGKDAARDSIGFVEWHDDADWPSMLRAVYTAMCNAAPPEPDLDEDALVETTIETAPRSLMLWCMENPDKAAARIAELESSTGSRRR